MDIRTSVYDAIAVEVVEGTSDLPCKLASDSFPETTMADDVVEHLTPVDVFEDHVVVMLMDDHFTHAADVRMVEQHRESSLPDGADFLGSVFRCLLSDGLWRRIRTIGNRRGWMHAGENFDGELGKVSGRRERGLG